MTRKIWKYGKATLGQKIWRFIGRIFKGKKWFRYSTILEPHEWEEWK